MAVLAAVTGALYTASRYTSILPADRRLVAPHPEPAADSVGRWRQDLAFLSKEVTRLHVDPYHQVSPEVFASETARLDAAIPDLTDDEIVMGMARLTALIGEAHTRVNIGRVVGNVYPLAVEWLSDGLVVMGATPLDSELVGTRIVAIEGVPLATVIERLLPYLSRDNDHVKAQLPRYLLVPEILDVILADESRAPGEITFQHPSGAIATRSFPTINPLEFVTTVRAFRPRDGLPLHLRHNSRLYWYEVVDDGRTMVVGYNRCEDDPDRPFAEFTEEVFAEIETRGIENLVIDLRHNEGGNSEVFRPFMERLDGHRIDRPGRLWVIVGRETFSSAILNAVELEQRTSATFVGEPTPGRPNHYGEVRSFELPNSSLEVDYSIRYFSPRAEDTDSFYPELAVEPSSADAFAGRDPVLEAIIERT